MAIIEPVFIVHSELVDQRGENTSLKLCEAIDAIIPGEIYGSQLWNGVWSIWIKSQEARSKLTDIKTIDVDNVSIALYKHFPITKPPPNERITFRGLPFWVTDDDILMYVRSLPGVVVKSGVISSRLRDMNNKLTKFFSGDRFVFVKGKLTHAFHSHAIIRNAKCRIWHKSQEFACKRCRRLGHTYSNTEACKAYKHGDDVINIRSPKNVLSNFYPCNMKIYEQDFRSSEHAYQWRFLKYLELDDLANEVLAARSPADAKEIAWRVPLELHKGWHGMKCTVMKQILHAKADYCPLFKSTLMDSGNKNLVESTQDLFWASGLSPHDSSTTHPVFYPGSNQLGRVLESIRTELHRESVLIKQLSTDNHDDPSTPVPADKQHAPASQRVPKDLDAANGDQPSPSTPPVQETANSPGGSPHTTHPGLHNESPKHPPSDEVVIKTGDDADNQEVSEASSDQSVMDIEPNATSTECEDNADVGDSSDCEEITMSGVEELIDSLSDVTTKGSPVPTTSVQTTTQLPPKPVPRRKVLRKKTSHVTKLKGTMESFLFAVKRKLTPGKEEDTSRESIKMQHGDSSKS